MTAAAAVAACCFHCGEGLPRGLPVAEVTVDGRAEPMCCFGCAAVAEAIVAAGQSGYYRERTAYADTALPQALAPAELALYDLDDAPFGDGEATLAVDGIRCAACVWLIEQRLAKLPGVTQASMNIGTGRLFVRWDRQRCSPSAILGAVRAIGYRAWPFDPARHGEALRSQGKAMLRRLFVAALCMMQVMMYAVPAYLATDGTLDAPMEQLLRWASLLLTLPVMGYCAWPFFSGAWRSLVARAPGMDVPVVLGIVAAFAASTVATVQGQGEVYFDTITMFVALLLCGRYLELGARRAATLAMERLHHQLPAAANRLDNYPASRTQAMVAAQALAAGDIILVKPGDLVAADGVVVEGDSAVDLSMLTGESRPLACRSGDAVAGGALNVTAPLLVRVTRPAQHSMLARLVRLAEQAGQGKPHMAQWADRVATWFVGALLLLAVVVFGYWHWADPARAWPIAIAVLVVSCPCALSLAVPTALAAAGDALLRRGVLLIRSHALETLAGATHIVFDKTGTLTMGKPVLHQVVPLGALRHERCLALAAALEAGSRHPLAAAVVAAAGADVPLAHATCEQPGRGVEGTVEGLCYRLGSADFVAQWAGSLDSTALHAGAIYLGCRGQWLASLLLTDPVRPDALAVIHQFQQAGKEVILLSGDAAALVRQVGHLLGIDDVHARQLPEQKLAFVQQLQSKGAVVAMVGDGINDAAVLGAADVSVAMGSGAPWAQAQADVVLFGDGLAPLGLLAARGAQALAVMRQNLVWASIYNLVAIPAAAVGWLNPWLSGLGMTISSALVVLNSLRLRR